MNRGLLSKVDYLIEKKRKKHSDAKHVEKTPTRVNTSLDSYSETTDGDPKKVKRKKHIYIKYKYNDSYENEIKKKSKQKNFRDADQQKCK